MSNLKDLESLKNDLANSIKLKEPEFNKIWKDLNRYFGSKFVDFLQSLLNKYSEKLDYITNFKLNFIADTNFVLGTVKEFAKDKKDIKESFIYKILESKHIKVYAPIQMRLELKEQIDKIVIENNELAHNYADKLLEKIILKDAYYVYDWQKAKKQIQDIDSKDTAFLALAIEMKNGIIISNDKVFDYQQFSKKWKIGETRQIVTNCHEGIISFCFIGSMAYIFEAIINFTMLFFKLLIDSIKNVVKQIQEIILKISDLASKIPEEVLMTVVAGVVAVSLIYFYKKNPIKSLDELKQILKEAKNEIIKMLSEIISILKELYELLKPKATSALKFIAYLTTNCMILIKEMQELEI